VTTTARPSFGRPPGSRRKVRAPGITVPLTLQASADELIEYRCNLQRCMSLLLALFGHAAISELSLLSEGLCCKSRFSPMTKILRTVDATFVYKM
jgi:hypothetical protein